MPEPLYWEEEKFDSEHAELIPEAGSGSGLDNLLAGRWAREPSSSAAHARLESKHNSGTLDKFLTCAAPPRRLPATRSLALDLSLASSSMRACDASVSPG